MTAPAEPFPPASDLPELTDADAVPVDLTREIVRHGPSEAELAASSAYLGRVLTCTVAKMGAGYLGSYVLAHAGGEMLLPSETVVKLAEFLRARPRA